MSSIYKDKKSDVGKYLRYCFGLQYLRPSDVGDCFAIDLGAIQPADARVVQFSDYLVDNYISESSRYPPHVWAEQSSSTKRTTNACESFHSRYNSSFYHTHPHIFQFIRVLLDFQSDTYIKIRSIQNNIKKTYSSQTNENKKFVNQRIWELENNKITTLEFVQLMGNRFYKH